MPMDDM